MELGEIDLNVAERQLDEHERRLQESAARALRLQPVFDEAREAFERIERGLVDELENLPAWQVWRTFSTVLALKAARRFHAHFLEVVQSLPKAEKEIKRVHEDERWARIALWRQQ